jgi:hypothetical protein
MRRVLATCATVLLAGCELQEVAIAEAEPFVVVESFLSAGLEAVVAVHASAGRADLLGPDALVQLVAEDTTIVLERVRIDRCLSVGYSFDEADFPGGLACYVEPFPDSVPDAWEVEAAELYRLSVRMPDGTTLDGATRVPDPVAFAIDDDSPGCYIEPWTQAELVWNPAEGAAAYILDVSITGLEEALAREGIVVDIDEPLSLRGLSIGEADTSIVLPAEIGVFDRFALAPEIALALQRGLPPDVRFEIVLAAVDNNYVDWVRGGDFNPSGPLRIPSMYGDAGTGAFGSMTLDFLIGTTDRSAVPDDAPACGQASAPQAL